MARFAAALRAVRLRARTPCRRSTAWPRASVGLAFPPPGAARLIDRIDRDALRARRPARCRRAPDDAGAAARRRLRQPLPGPRAARRRRRRPASCPTAARAQLQFRGPSATSGYYRNPEATQEPVRRRLARTPATAPTSPTASSTSPAARRTSSSAAAATSTPTSSRRRWATSPASARGCVAVFGSDRRRAAAPSAWWCSPRRASRDAARARASCARHQRARGRR